VEQIETNFYSGFSFDTAGRRRQMGVSAAWQPINRHHNLSVQYDCKSKLLSCFANGMKVHQLLTTLDSFMLEIRFEAVGMAGDFEVDFENLYYFDLDAKGIANVVSLNGWDPQYAPVFISYCHSDREPVMAIVDELRAKGVRVLGDWQLGIGDSLIEKLSAMISRAGYLIIALSRAAAGSRWVQREVQLGLIDELEGNRNVKVLPVLLEQCEIPAALRGRLYLDLSSSQPRSFERLLKEIRSLGIW
jgi:hypothetical protein